MKYAGLELENFDKAHIWRKYIFFLIRKYFSDDFLEVGAGIGSFTKNYFTKFNNIVLSEIDANNLVQLKKKFSNYKNVEISNNSTKDINKKIKKIIGIIHLHHCLSRGIK